MVAGIAGQPLPGLWPIEDWPADFQLTGEESLDGVLGYYAETAELTARIVTAVGDLGQPSAVNPGQSVRWVLFHLIQETSRHAGHAGIIREALDGGRAGQLLDAAGDRDNLRAHPEYLILGPEGLAEGRTYVADAADGSVVGFATWAGDADGTVELEDLFVDPRWRRRGSATALVSHVVDVLRARGVRCLQVTANPHAEGFYRAAGFIDCGVAETVFGPSPRKRLTIGQ